MESLKSFRFAEQETTQEEVGKYFDHISSCRCKKQETYLWFCNNISSNISTGSRTNVKVEDMKPEEVSLKPFFDIQKKSATAILTEVKGVIRNENLCRR